MCSALPVSQTRAAGAARAISARARGAFSLGCSFQMISRPAAMRTTSAMNAGRSSQRAVSRMSELQTSTNPRWGKSLSR